MKAQNIMTSGVKSCQANSTLAAAATIMWDNDCGSVPVVDDAEKVIGIITDRDICMALAFRDRIASDVTVGEIISGPVFTCDADDNIEDVLEIMSNQKLRRLPVVNAAGLLSGILSLNDIVLHAKRGESKKGAHVSHKEVMATLKAICAHRDHLSGAQPAPVE